MTTRFAPSPTGLLHLGHAYAALVAHRLAHQHHGTFLLRFEDIDHTRVRPEFYVAIEEDLRWLGLTWQGAPLHQTDRLPAYAAALEQLNATQVLYPCFCTRRDIAEETARITNAPHGPEGPLYPGTCRALSADQRAALLAADTPHCWRLDAAAASQRLGPLTFRDQRHGEIPVDPALLGDVILARKDIATSYHLAVVVDDAFQHISLVTRGEDLLPATHVHRLLQGLLALPEPTYHHHPLILDANGQRLAKRDESQTIRSLRASGLSPEETIRRATVA
ncbi:MAG: tRNA glutamyl-Q(34) synthetase GluQRS [Verrucomicrobia bacterium]|nr:tRNA glutamyl-Q(34) synthetase GluQRS [Verrucomicrobiota bacterium]